ncbi:MAG: exodeoxyribonuclease III [Sedimentisphaerales bacterium]|nr:exodeoxyribonuclease III [Sedimentisphaerales bacterium]
MKVATFNANSLRSRLHIVLPWVGANQPDILCIQETKVQDHEFPIDVIAETGYQTIFCGEKKYNGVAILSRCELNDIVFGLDDEPKDPARLICARLESTWILNTYIPQGRARDSEMFAYKLRWFERLKIFLNRRFTPTDRILWMGDFNVARDERDVYDPKRLWGHVCYCQEVQDVLQDLMDWGFIDLFRQFCEEPGHYTFWDYRMPRALQQNLGWRLDYIMATQSVAIKAMACQIDTKARAFEKPSDHTFLVAEFDF